MPSLTPPYRSYLLRLWLAGDDEHPQWRTALIDPQLGECHGFVSLEDLTAFLKTRKDEASANLPESRDKDHVVHPGRSLHPEGEQEREKTD